jgi:phosphoketolase
VKTTTAVRPVDTDVLRRYRRAADFLAAAMIFLKDNVLLRQPLRADHLKPRLLGHWGTCPGITFVHAGLSLLGVDTPALWGTPGRRPGQRGRLSSAGDRRRVT